jgi:hypothetical protein
MRPPLTILHPQHVGQRRFGKVFDLAGQMADQFIKIDIQCFQCNLRQAGQGLGQDSLGRTRQGRQCQLTSLGKHQTDPPLVTFVALLGDAATGHQLVHHQAAGGLMNTHAHGQFANANGGTAFDLLQQPHPGTGHAAAFLDEPEILAQGTEDQAELLQDLKGEQRRGIVRTGMQGFS